VPRNRPEGPHRPAERTHAEIENDDAGAQDDIGGNAGADVTADRDDASHDHHDGEE
jgi:hypothetical protein